MKFFKKLRFLDFFLIATFLFAIIFLFRFFKPEERWIDGTVYVNNVPLFQANSFNVGDVERSPSGKETAKITKILVYDTELGPLATVGKNVRLNKDLFIKLKILVKVNSRSGDFEYKNKIVKAGSPIQFNFDTGFFSGKIASFGESGEQNKTEEREVTFVLYDQWSWLADRIEIGAGEKVERGKDSKNIIEIVAKETRLSKSDINKVDITLKTKVEMQQFGDEFIFRHDERIAVGEPISFMAGTTRIESALVKNIE